MAQAQRAPASSEISQRPSDPFDISALSAGGPDILVAPADVDYRKLCEDEKFMHEMIQIIINDNGDPNAPKFTEIRVDTGGITGREMGDATDEFPYGKPAIAGRGGRSFVRVLKRNIKYEVPRFVFEVLAHSNVQTLTQETVGMNPEPVNRTEKKFSYNFQCVYDPNPKGQGWREWVLAHPA